MTTRRRRACADRPARLLEPLEPRQLLATISWDGGAGTNSWHDAANWSGDQLPGPADHVVINVAGSAFLIRHSQNVQTSVASISNLEPLVLSSGSISTSGDWVQNAAMTISGGSIGGDGKFYLKGPMTWLAGSMTGLGRTIVEAGRTLKITGAVTLARTLFVDGILNWQSGDIRFEDGSLVARTTGVMNARGVGAARDISGTNLLGVNGRFVRDVTGYSEAVVFVEVPLQGVGTVELPAAVLRVRRGAISQLLLSGGGLVVDENLRITDFMSWSDGWVYRAVAGNQPPTGRLTIAAGAALSITAPPTGGQRLLGGTILENLGTVSWGNSQLRLLNAVIENRGEFHAYGGDIMTGSFAESTFENRGVFLKHGSWELTIAQSIAFNNYATGVVDVEAGALRALVGGTNHGMITGAPGTTLWIGPSYTIAGGVIDGFQSIISVGTVNWAGGSIVGNGVLIVIQNPSSSFVLRLSGTGQKVLGRQLINQSRVELAGGTLLLQGGSIQNDATMVITGGALVVSGPAATLTNTPAATLEKAGATAFSLTPAGLSFSNTGRLMVRGGSLTLNTAAVAQVSGSTLTGGRWNVFNGATLDLTGAPILTNNATINIAGSGASFGAISGLRVNNGTLTLAGGAFTIQPGSGALVNNGKLSVFSGGTFNLQGGLTLNSTSRFLAGITSPSGYGRVLTTGTIATGGQLEALFTLFIPTPIDSFAILSTAGSTVTGFFTTTVTSGLPNGLIASPVYLPWSVRIFVD